MSLMSWMVSSSPVMMPSMDRRAIWGVAFSIVSSPENFATATKAASNAAPMAAMRQKPSLRRKRRRSTI